MNDTQTIGIDTAKRVFFLHGESHTGGVTLRKKLARDQLLPFLANQPPSLIALEAGCGAHHWARSFSRLGHEVRLIHPKFVRPFVKTNKNDDFGARRRSRPGRIADGSLLIESDRERADGLRFVQTLARRRPARAPCAESS